MSPFYIEQFKQLFEQAAAFSVLQTFSPWAVKLYLKSTDTMKQFIQTVYQYISCDYTSPISTSMLIFKNDQIVFRMVLKLMLLIKWSHTYMYSLNPSKLSECMPLL